MSLNKKAVAVIGGIAGVVGLGWLISRSLAKPAVPVTLTSNPIRTILLIDDKTEVATPNRITLTKGKHRFAAMPKSPDLTLTYGFRSWTVNRHIASYNPIMEIDIAQPTLIKANFLVSESGVYPIIAE